MKLLLKSIAVATLVSIIFTMIPFSVQCQNVSKEVFRLHILANSDTEEDQALKIKVRDEVLKYSERIYQNADSISSAKNLTSENLQYIANVAQQEIYNNGYSYPVKAEICNMYFNTRYYDKVTMPSGNYDALRIIIGNGEGKNWWCVMYPSLCVGTATDYKALEDNVTDNEYQLMTENKCVYKFKIVEYFEKICSFFS